MDMIMLLNELGNGNGTLRAWSLLVFLVLILLCGFLFWLSNFNQSLADLAYRERCLYCLPFFSTG
jgi:hypothetical protein